MVTESHRYLQPRIARQVFRFGLPPEALRNSGMTKAYRGSLTPERLPPCHCASCLWQMRTLWAVSEGGAVRAAWWRYAYAGCLGGSGELCAPWRLQQPLWRPLPRLVCFKFSKATLMTSTITRPFSLFFETRSAGVVWRGAWPDEAQNFLWRLTSTISGHHHHPSPDRPQTDHGSLLTAHQSYKMGAIRESVGKK